MSAMLNKLTILILALAAIAAIAATAFYGSDRLVKRQVLQRMDALGISGLQPAAIRVENKTALIEDIRLDADGFSTIENLQADFTLPDFKIKRLIVDNAVLTGNLDESGAIEITGFPPLSRLLDPSALPDEIIIQGVRLELITLQGGIRIEGKASITRTSSGNYSISAVIWGQQHQLKFNSQWQGIWEPDGSFSLDAELNDGGFHLDNLMASRINGWLAVEGMVGAPLESHSGQINIGNLNLGGMPYRNPVITWQVDPARSDIIVKGQSAGHPGVDIALEINGSELNSSFETTSLPAMLSFMTALHRTLSKDTLIPENYTKPVASLLGAHQDRRTLEKTLKADKKYDLLQLVIEGPFDDLLGKVVAREISGKSAKQHVIRLEPALDSAPADVR